jgi:hypothetical protein
VSPRSTGLLLVLFVVAGAAFAYGLWALGMSDDWMALAFVSVGAMALRSVLAGVQAVEKGAR